MENKKAYTPALVLAIIGLVFSLLSPLISYICCIAALVPAITKKSEYKVKAVIVICVIGLIIAVANHILGAMIMSGAIKLT